MLTPRMPAAGRVGLHIFGQALVVLSKANRGADWKMSQPVSLLFSPVCFLNERVFRLLGLNALSFIPSSPRCQSFCPSPPSGPAQIPHFWLPGGHSAAPFLLSRHSTFSVFSDFSLVVFPRFCEVARKCINDSSCQPDLPGH